MKRLREDLQRYRWHLIAACAAFMLARWWILRGKPERLMDVPHELLAIRGGQVYWIEKDSKQENMVVVRASVSGGSRREIGREDIRGAEVRNATVTDTGIFYLLLRPPSGLTRNSPQSALGLPGGMLPPPGDVVPPRPNASMRMPRATLRYLPLSRGGPQIARPDLQSASIAIVSNTLYWVEVQPNERARVADRAGRRAAPIPRSRLMAMPLQGGRPRTMATGLYPDTELYAGQEGVCWMMPPRSSPSRGDLCCLRAADAKPLVLRDYDGRPPVESGGRLYWIERIYQGNPGLAISRLLRTNLVSMNADGSDRRTLLTLPTSENTALAYSRLAAHRGRLYVLIAEHITRANPTHNHRAVLYRLTQTSPPALETVYKFPQHSMAEHFFDEGYYYFTILEDRENVFDWSPSGLFVERTPVLYRYRLPD